MAAGSLAAPVKTGRAEVVGLELTVGVVETVGVVTIVAVINFEEVIAAIEGAIDVEEVAAAVGAVYVEDVDAAIVGTVEVGEVVTALVGTVEIEDEVAPSGFGIEGQYGCKAWYVSTRVKLTFVSSAANCTLFCTTSTGNSRCWSDAGHCCRQFSTSVIRPVSLQKHWISEHPDPVIWA